MVIILEGLDGVGKSTISRMLSDKIGFPIIAERYPGNDMSIKNERFELLKNNVKSKKNVIYDRCTCIDDFVYSFLNNNKKSDMIDYVSQIEAVLSECIIIHLSPSNYDKYIVRFKKRGDEYVSIDDLNIISNSYTDFYSKLSLNPVHIKSYNNDLYLTIRKIIEHLKTRKEFNFNDKN